MMYNETESFEFVRSLVSSFPSGIIAFDIEGFVTIVNREFTNLLQLNSSTSELTDMSIIGLLPNGQLKNQVVKCLEKGRAAFEIPMLKIHDQYIDVKGVKLLNGMLLVLNNVTPLIELKNEATELIIKSQEIERSRIAKEMHDGIGPTLSTIKLGLERITKAISEEEQKERLKQVANSILEVSKEIRSISHDLMPSSIIDFGLLSALGNFVNKTNENTDFKITLNCSVNEEDLNHIPKNFEVSIFRIIQEATNNAIKYSECSQLDISLTQENNQLHLLISDDGKGYNVANVTHGIGVKNMKTRVESMHGLIKISSKLNEGVTISIKLPIFES